MFGDCCNAHVVGYFFLVAKLYAVGTTLAEDIKLYTIEGTGTGRPRENGRRCAVLATTHKFREELALLLEKKAKLVEINITFEGYSSGLLQDPDRKLYKPWLWVRTTGRHGQALLMLPFHYQMLSLWTLSVGTEKMNTELRDEPTGCLETLGFDKRIVLIREFLLNDFKPLSGGITGSLSENEYVCVQRLKNVKIFGEFVYECCRYGPDGEKICLDLSKEFWIGVLENFLTALKIIIFLFLPLMLPDSLFKPLYVQNQYKVKLEEPVHLSIYVSDRKPSCEITYQKRLNAKELSMWPTFNKLVKSKGNEDCPIPWNEKVHLSTDTLLLKIQQRRFVSTNSVPVSLLTYLRDNFIRCKIRQVDPFVSCCKASICGPWKPALFQTVSWLSCFKFLIRILVFILVPLPFYIRLGLYTAYEHDEMLARKEALKLRGLWEQPTTNILQYLSPTHPLFVIIYILYIVEGTGIRLLSTNLRLRFKFVLRKSFREVKCLEIRKKLTKAGQRLIYPLETYGCFGFIIGLFYWLYTIPFLIFGVCVYNIPMLYLSFRVVHSFVGIIVELHKRRGIVGRLTKRKDLKKVFETEMINFGILDFLPGYLRKEGKLRLMMKPFIRELLLQILILICTIASIYMITILLVECIGFFLEMFAFTLMGIIVNAGKLMRYVSLCLLVALYLQDCFKNVNENYLTLGQKIIEEAQKRVDDIEEVASKSSMAQTKMGFVVKTVEDNYNPAKNPVQLDNDHCMPRWKFSRPLLFLDNNDKRYVSVRFFEAFTTTTEAGSPGPVLNRLLKATRKFLIMLAFLGFVFIVVLVFGDSYSISSTNQTLATVVGGILPWLLNNFIKGKQESLSLNHFSFRFLFDKFASQHKKTWAISDIVIRERGENLDVLDGVECKDNTSTQPNLGTNDSETISGDPEVSPNHPETNISGSDVVLGLETSTGQTSNKNTREKDSKNVTLFIDLSSYEKELEVVATKDLSNINITTDC